MPTNPYMYAGDLVDVLKKKHASGTYKSLVNYSVAVFIDSIKMLWCYVLMFMHTVVDL